MIAPGEVLHVVGLPDPIYDRLGHDPRSSYVETFWLGTLGPSTTWLLRHVAAELDRSPEGFDMDLAQVASRLGIGHRHGPNSPMSKALARAVQFGMARAAGPSRMAFRRKLPPLSPRQVANLAAPLAEAHRQADIPPAHASRSRRLAASLLALGESPEQVHSKLVQWRFPDAAEAVSWAQRARPQDDTGCQEQASSTSVRTPKPLPPLRW